MSRRADISRLLNLICVIMLTIPRLNNKEEANKNNKIKKKYDYIAKRSE